MVSMGTERGGRALARLLSRCGLCRAGVGWREGRRCAWQPGPAWDVAGPGLDAGPSLRPREGPPPPEVS